DPAVLDKVELAQGTLATTGPADAPAAMASIASSKLRGFIACCVVAAFRWWVGAALLVFWLVSRAPLRRQARSVARSFAGEAGVLRRAGYFGGLASQPMGAKELRIFGLGPWTVANFKEHFLDGMTRVWKAEDRQLWFTL